jgi:hypothetical protein
MGPASLVMWAFGTAPIVRSGDKIGPAPSQALMGVDMLPEGLPR